MSSISPNEIGIHLVTIRIYTHPLQVALFCRSYIMLHTAAQHVGQDEELGHYLLWDLSSDLQLSTIRSLRYRMRNK